MNYTPDAIFPTNNLAEIPILKKEHEAKFLTAPVQLWGARGSRKMKMPGTYLFYTEDYRFENLWKNPNHIFASGCLNAVEPNFSCYNETPFPVALHQIYRKRWIARYWQEAGINIFVDLNVHPKFAEINLLGVPKGWKAYATRGYNETVEFTEKEYDLACNHAGTDEILFVVYGGGKEVKKLCQSYPFVHICEEMENHLFQKQNKELNPNQMKLIGE